MKRKKAGSLTLMVQPAMRPQWDKATTRMVKSKTGETLAIWEVPCVADPKSLAIAEKIVKEANGDTSKKAERRYFWVERYKGEILWCDMPKPSTHSCDRARELGHTIKRELWEKVK